MLDINEKLAQIKAMAAKKPIPNINPNFRYKFSDRFIHFLDVNKYQTTNYYIEDILALVERPTQNNMDSITLIDIGSESDTISYVETNKITKMFYNDTTPTLNKDLNTFNLWYTEKLKDPNFWKLNRTEIKAGRFIKKLLNCSDVISSEFSQRYKSYNDSYNYVFEIVGGQDIVKFYRRENYDISNQRSSLATSCMAIEKKQEQSRIEYGETTLEKKLQLYALNENCALLILRLKDSKKIKGRCLMWRTSTDNIYLDRVYVDNESDLYLFKKYANDNKFYSHSNNKTESNMQIDCNDEVKIIARSGKIPYLDSFSYNTIKDKLVRK